MKEEIRKTYYENGNMESERTFVDGIEHGPAKGWFESGELEFEAFKENGLVQGLVKNYFENGNLCAECNYIDQVKEGEEKSYFENGQLQTLRNFEKGIICGVEKIYNEDGTLQCEIERVYSKELEDIGIISHYKGKPFTGIAFSVHKNGNVEIETEMLEGLKHSMEVVYNEDSSVDKVNYYENDLLIGHDENTYDKMTNNIFPNSKYDDFNHVCKVINEKISFREAVYNRLGMASEDYFETLTNAYIDSLYRSGKLSKETLSQVELNQEESDTEESDILLNAKNIKHKIFNILEKKEINNIYVNFQWIEPNREFDEVEEWVIDDFVLIGSNQPKYASGDFKVYKPDGEEYKVSKSSLEKWQIMTVEKENKITEILSKFMHPFNYTNQDANCLLKFDNGILTYTIEEDWFNGFFNSDTGNWDEVDEDSAFKKTWEITNDGIIEIKE